MWSILDHLTEKDWLMFLALMMICLGVLTMLVLMSGIKAMYGRYTVESSFSVDARLAWFLQEVPAFAYGFYYLCTGTSTYGRLALALFSLHYFYRALIYPWLLNSPKGSPWFIFLSAVFFCMYNGYLQGAWHGKYYEHEIQLTSWTTMIGLAMFFFGLFTHMHADHILRNLRKPGESGYKIPKGGMFEYVSGANYFGEIIEWCGFFLVAQSLPALAFAVFTISNIGPRAYQHHNFYLEKFDDYPRNRKALIPFIL